MDISAEKRRLLDLTDALRLAVFVCRRLWITLTVQLRAARYVAAYIGSKQPPNGSRKSLATY
jgi:hypothetical protein